MGNNDVERVSRPDQPVKFDSNDSSFITPDALAVWAEIQRLGLESNVAELETLGYTIVPPEKVAKPELITALRHKILGIYRARYGETLTENDCEYFDNFSSPLGNTLSYLLFEDRLFQEAMLNPVSLAMTDYTVGKKAIAYNCLALIKGRGSEDMDLHTDNFLMSAPYAAHHQVVNITWLLTDYSRENGALCFVPGSHKYARTPLPNEGVDYRVAVEAPAGSLAIWTGSTWHGAFARKTKGLRVSLVQAMCRPHIRPQEPYRENVTQELLESHPPRFSVLMGKHINFGWKEEGPLGGADPYRCGRHAYD